MNEFLSRLIASVVFTSLNSSSSLTILGDYCLPSFILLCRLVFFDNSAFPWRYGSIKGSKTSLTKSNWPSAFYDTPAKWLCNSEIENIENDLSEIIKEAKGKEPKPIPATSLKKKDVQELFGTEHSKTMDVSWADVSTSDFQKPKLLGKMLHPLMISVSDRDSRRGTGYFRKDPEELHQ